MKYPFLTLLLGLSLWVGVQRVFAVDTLKVVAVMMEFQKDGQNDNTTGDGQFDSDSSYTLDNINHNKEYFENQLEFVKNYFLFASDSNLIIQYTVIDQGDGIYNHLTLPAKMKHYRIPAKQDKESYDEFNLRLNQGIMAFSMDALRKVTGEGLLDSGKTYPADNNDSLRVDDSTLVLIFHAGATQLTDGGLYGSLGADTPSDIIDSYISPQDFKAFDGMVYHDDATTVRLSFDKKKGKGCGVFSKDSTYFFQKLMMSPETASQDGLNFGIHGIIINQIGRAMGLPDLWNTKEGISAVGGFCLMDVAGYNTYNGFIPVLPSAWCRVQLGWVKNPIVAQPDSNGLAEYHLASTHVGNGDNEIIKIPLSSSEYLLLENRQYLPYRTDSMIVKTAAGDSFSYDLYDTTYGGPWVEMFSDSLCLDDSCHHRRQNDRKAHGRMVSANSYDVGLPGFGVLVWHVDETVIRAHLEEDMVNANTDRRGVNLVEADGIEDIGVALSNLIETIYLYGGPEDFFPHKEYADNRYVNTLLPYNRANRFFGTQTNTGGYTGITITIDTLQGLSKQQKYLNTAAYQLGHTQRIGLFAADSFKITVSWTPNQGAWPKIVDSTTASTHVVSRGDTLFMVTDSGVIFKYRADGTFLNADSTVDSTLNKKGFRCPSSFSVGDDGFYFGILDSLRTATILVRYQPNSFVMLDTLLQDTLSTSIALLVGDTLIFGTKQGRLYKAARSFDSALVLSAGHPVTAFAVNGTTFIAACNGKVYQGATTTMVSSVTVTPAGLIGTDWRLAGGNVWPDKAGMEWVICDAAGHVTLLDNELRNLPGWPVKIDSRAVLSPALGDVDGDGRLDVVLPGNNKVYAINYTGTFLSHWPFIADTRTSLGQFTSSASLFDLDGNHRMEIFVPAPNGNILILEGDGRMYEFTAGAKVLNRSLPLGGKSAVSCVVRNLDQDSSNTAPHEEMEVFALNGNGVLSCFALPTSRGYGAGWECEGGSYKRHYMYSGKTPQAISTASSLEVDTLFTCPNPARRVNQITIKYRLSKATASVGVKLFNSMGDLILDKKGLPNFSLWNHYVLDISKLAPGMYTLKLEAGDAFRFTKLGVIR